MCFAGLVAFYSGQMLNKGGGESRAKVVKAHSVMAGLPSSGIGKSMTGMLNNAVVKVREEMQDQMLAAKQREAAANMARRALSEQTQIREKHRVTAVIVFKEPGMNLNLALRSVCKRSFIREALIVHDLGPVSASMPTEWSDPPKSVYGKPVKYLPRRGERRELLKYDACASDADPRNEICYYQSPTRDTSNYLESLFSSFLRAPHLLHTAVGATTLYSDLQLTFREDSFGIGESPSLIFFLASVKALLSLSAHISNRMGCNIQRSSRYEHVQPRMGSSAHDPLFFLLERP